MEKALDIDNSDPTLFFKFAVIAIRAGDLMSARNALEVSLRVTETIPGQQIRHWPTLDLLITVTYKLEDCLSCLRHIDWALKVISGFVIPFQFAKLQNGLQLSSTPSKYAQAL